MSHVPQSKLIYAMCRKFFHSEHLLTISKQLIILPKSFSEQADGGECGCTRVLTSTKYNLICVVSDMFYILTI